MPVGIGGWGDPWYTPGQHTDPQQPNWPDTQVIGGPGGYLESNPEVAYNRWLSMLGISSEDQRPWAQFLRDRFRQAWGGYQMALADKPMLQFQGPQGYLQGVNPQALRAQFDRLSPMGRGERRSTFVGPTRTIADI